MKPDLIRRRKRQIRRRLDQSASHDRGRPMIQGANTAYELSQKTHGTAYGGVAATHAFATKLGLPERIDQSLHLFKKQRRFVL
ncbi:hypothetical protein Enr13x_21700 [Stieleria neptunia]|uniref:Uncharacterized protein n=1 Tax=Stieleria neptunia TaxID=2527979 RepID=A0A518HN91_9BACT|nr:hypothetical protein [Stieleria neptunia]QDV42325.1 hypothetical protein Enr13x_21700 [Stieleria neptunia]